MLPTFLNALPALDLPLLSPAPQTVDCNATVPDVAIDALVSGIGHFSVTPITTVNRERGTPDERARGPNEGLAHQVRAHGGGYVRKALASGYATVEGLAEGDPVTRFILTMRLTATLAGKPAE